MALVYGGNAATMKNYLVLVEDAGIYWSLVKSGGSYAVYSSYYLLELVPEVEKLFNAGLTDEASDFYTTGGTDPESISFNFAEGTVVWNGSPYRFIWNYETNEMGSTYPSVVFLTDIQTDADGNAVSYNYHSIRIFDQGLQMSTFNTASQEDDSTYAYYISDSVFQDILGLSFTYRGEYYDETMILNEDGSFAIATTDKTNSDAAVSMVTYPYFLQRFFDKEGRENIIVGFNSSGTLYIYAYIVERECGKVFDIVYSADDVLDFIGTYYAGTDSVEFTRDAGVKVNGTAAKVTNMTKTASSVTLTYTYETTEYTAVFSGRYGGGYDRGRRRRDLYQKRIYARGVRGNVQLQRKRDRRFLLGGGNKLRACVESDCGRRGGYGAARFHGGRQTAAFFLDPRFCDIYDHCIHLYFRRGNADDFRRHKHRDESRGEVGLFQIRL